MSVILPYSFVPGTIAKAKEVNKNFEVLRNAANASESNIEELQNTTENLQNNKANKNGNTSEVFKCANAVNNYDAINKQSLNDAIYNTIDYISGLSIAKDGTYSIIVSTGSCYDTTHAKILKLTNSISKDNSDQVASTTYYVYIIGNSSNSSVDITISTSSVSPSYPSASYNIYRQIGKFKTDENNVIELVSYYGASQSGGINSGMALEMFSALYPDMSVAQSNFQSAVWNSSTGQDTVINSHYILSSGHNWKVSVDGYVNWVCNEQDSTQNLKIGESTDNLVTVARVRAAAADDDSGTAAFIPIRKGMYVTSSKSSIYFYPLRGV